MTWFVPDLALERLVGGISTGACPNSARFGPALAIAWAKSVGIGPSAGKVGQQWPSWGDDDQAWSESGRAGATSKADRILCLEQANPE